MNALAKVSKARLVSNEELKQLRLSLEQLSGTEVSFVRVQIEEDGIDIKEVRFLEAVCIDKIVQCRSELLRVTGGFVFFHGSEEYEKLMFKRLNRMD